MAVHLYEINSEIAALEALIDAYAAEHEGDIPEDLDSRLETMKGIKNDKLLDLGRWVKNMEAEAEAVKVEKQKLAARQSALEHKAERIRQYIAASLQPGEKLADTNTVFSWRKSVSTEIIDAEMIPDDFCAIIRKPSATEIKAAIQSGKQVPGARLNEKLNLQIK